MLLTASVGTVQGRFWHQELFQKMDLSPFYPQMPAVSKLSDSLLKITINFHYSQPSLNGHPYKTDTSSIKRWPSEMCGARKVQFELILEFPGRGGGGGGQTNEHSVGCGRGRDISCRVRMGHGILEFHFPGLESHEI